MSDFPTPVRPKIERAPIEKPSRVVGKVDDVEHEIKWVMLADEDQIPNEFETVTYEYTAPFFYPNFYVELGDETKGVGYCVDGVEIDVPPQGAITFTHEEPIVGVEIIGCSSCAPATVYIHCEPLVWKFSRSGVKMKRDNLWGEHIRDLQFDMGLTEQFKKSGLFSARFKVPESKKITIMGHGSFDVEKEDCEKGHYDAHLTVKTVRVLVKKAVK